MVVSNVFLSDKRVTLTSRNGSELLASFACVNSIEVNKLFRMNSMLSTFILESTNICVWLTYLCYLHTPILFNSCISIVSIWFMKIFAITDRSWTLIATSLWCTYISLVKLKWDSNVAVRSNIPNLLSQKYYRSHLCAEADMFLNGIYSLLQGGCGK
jgi:hypothetical protein